MPNIDLNSENLTTSFRRLAVGSWKRPKDPTVYAAWEMDVTHVLAYLERLNRDKETRVTFLHFFARTLAHGFERFPGLNCTLIRRKLRQRKNINIFFQVVVKQGKLFDLTGFSIHDANLLSLEQLALQHSKNVALIRSGGSVEYAKNKALLNRLPPWLSYPIVRVFDFLLYTLNLDLSRFGIVRDPFGSVMLSAIAPFGYDESYAPLFPFSRCGLSMTVGKIAKGAVIVDDQVVVRPVCRINVTADHRYIDGAQVAGAVRLIRKMVRNPEDYAYVFESDRSGDPSRFSSRVREALSHGPAR